MRWVRDKLGGLVPQRAKQQPAFVDPLEKHADAAADFYGFTGDERDEFLKMQRALAGNPALLKKLVRRQKRFMRAARMSPTIKSKRR